MALRRGLCQRRRIENRIKECTPEIDPPVVAAFGTVPCAAAAGLCANEELPWCCRAQCEEGVWTLRGTFPETGGRVMVSSEAMVMHLRNVPVSGDLPAHGLALGVRRGKTPSLHRNLLINLTNRHTASMSHPLPRRQMQSSRRQSAINKSAPSTCSISRPPKGLLVCVHE